MASKLKVQGSKPLDEMSMPELRVEVKRFKQEAITQAYCQEWGWKTLCKRFRAFMNKEAGLPPHPSTREYLAWTDERVKAAHKFFKENKIPKYKANDLVAHISVLKMRGYRKCFKCME